jgi:hypothetical protein
LVIFLTDAQGKQSTLGPSCDGADNGYLAAIRNFFVERIDARSSLAAGLVARFTRFVAKKAECWSAVAIAESEKSIARFDGMYNIRFDLRADRKTNYMKRLRRYKQNYHSKRCLKFEAAPAILSDGAILVPLFSISKPTPELHESASGHWMTSHTRRSPIEASTHVLEHARVVSGGSRRTT